MADFWSFDYFCVYLSQNLLFQEVQWLKDEIICLVSRNLHITERLDDGQFMALIELQVEADRSYSQPDFVYFRNGLTVGSGPR